MRVLFFAQTKDITGCDAVEVPAAAPLDAAQLWDELLKRFPNLAVQRANTRLARNHEFADATTRFQDGDEAALIPPVSGG